MNDDEKQNFLDNLEDKIRTTDDDLTDDEFLTLAALSQDSDSYYRVCVAEILVDFPEGQGEQILLNLTKDKIPLVRTFACESLGYNYSIAVYNRLKKIISRDKDCIVRGFTATSLANIAYELEIEERCLTFLFRILQKEKVTFTKICLYSALYTLGEKEYLYLLENEINTVKYQNRNAVINCFRDIISDDNRDFIKSTLISRKEVETTISVNSSIDALLKDISAD